METKLPPTPKKLIFSFFFLTFSCKKNLSLGFNIYAIFFRCKKGETKKKWFHFLSKTQKS